MSEHIKEKLWNIGLVVEDIKKFPQTYNTILGELKKDGTCQTILRRKLNSLCKSGKIFKTSIPGTRFGKAIYYYIPKNYHILVEGGRMGSKVYVFFNFERISKFYIQVNDYSTLRDGIWEEGKKPNIIFDGNILMWL